MFKTVGSAETLLKLLASYQGMNGRRPDLARVWSHVASYVTGEGVYRFYPASECESAIPRGRFLLDIGDLVRSGYLTPLPDGKLEVTALGRSVVRALSVPVPVEALEARILED